MFRGRLTHAGARLLCMPTDDTRMRYLREHLSGMKNSLLTQAERDDLTQYHFAEAVRQVRVIRRLGEAFAQERADEMPTQIADQVKQCLQHTSGAVQSMIDFQVEQPNAEQAHRQITQQVASQYNTMVNTLRTHIRGQADKAAAIERLDQATDAANTLIEMAKQSHKRADELVDRAEGLTAEIAAGTLSTYYDKQAAKHTTAARNFMIAAGLVAAAVGIASIPLFHSLNEGADTQWTAYARDLGVRVFALGIGLYLVTFLVRGYRANEHLRVVNEHKANALKTFLLFQESASEGDGTRDLITAELVKAVFASSETGFLDHSPDTTVIEGQAGLIALLAQQNRTGK